MVKYSSKRLKNVIKKTRKRLSYRRKNSMQNKILYGGDVRTLPFTLRDNTSYILTKNRILNFGISGAGKYKLEHGGTEIIPEMYLKEFILKLLSIENIEIINKLYEELKTKYNDDSFHFKSLYDTLNNLIIILEFRDDKYTKITIETFSSLLSNTGTIKYIENLDDGNMFKKNYKKLKKIYDDIKNKKELSELERIYKSLPLYKINPELQYLENSKTLGSGGFGYVYQVSFNGKICALKVITANTDYANYNNDIKQLMDSEVFAYNYISQLVCDEDNKLFCKFINTYVHCDKKTYNIKIYILMEYCGISLQNNMHRIIITNVSAHIYKWLLNTAKGLKCMHENKYAHLDIKPDNIVLDKDLNSKLIDFGLIYNFSRHNYSSSFNTVGTRDFMPPEMIQGTVESFEKCDIYSLGITFIECAFAFQHRSDYSNCFKTKESLSLLNSLLRYIPSEDELTSSQIPEILKLSSPVNNSDGNISINNPEYEIGSIITAYDRNNTQFNYNLRDLYIKILDIHKQYPLFKKMIQINPADRCNIEHIIEECEKEIGTLNAEKV